MIEMLQYFAALVIFEHAHGAGPDLPKRPDVLGIALVILAFALASRVLGALLARAAYARSVSLPALLLLASFGKMAALAVYYVIALPLGGAVIAQALGIDGWLFVPTALGLLPYFLLVAALSWGFHTAAKAMQIGAGSALGDVRNTFRSAIFAVAPIVAWIVFADVLRRAARADESSVVKRALEVLLKMPAAQSFLWLSFAFALLLFLPFAIRLFFRARPMPPSPIRARLEAYSLRVGFRARDILVWPHGRTLNAAVVGVLPRFRYVFITEGLLKTLDADEIEAVFAHEAGHARRGHVLIFFGFTGVMALVQFLPGAERLFGAASLFVPPLVLGLLPLVVWLGVVFGWISRRFEQEADVFGIDTLPPPLDAAPDADHPFARALDRIGREVGGIREVTGWRHFSIADRVEFVRRYVADADVRRRWKRQIALLRGALLATVVGFTLLAAVRLPGEMRVGAAEWRSREEPETRMLLHLNVALVSEDPKERALSLAWAGVHAAETKRLDDAARWLRESVALDPTNAEALVDYANVLEATGRAIGARRVWADVVALPDAPAALRDEARRRVAADAPR